MFPSHLKAVVFDLDGTLLDTAPEFIEVVQALRAEHDLAPMDPEAVRAVVSDGARAMVSLALDLAQDHELFEPKRLRFLEIYRDDLGRATSPYPGILALIETLAGAGITWGISTNKPSWLTEPLLQRLDLQPAPVSVVCPDHVSKPKPDPEPLLLNCEQLGCTPEEVVYIGDHPRDVDAGKAAGMYTIAAGYGYIHHDDDPANWGADAIARTSEELLALLVAVTRS
ncbi:MAG: HAD-IA family hydrolase [Halieaceae bacterium]|nr:HAD-IA family hydrolase [Halieaceae bacterium]